MTLQELERLARAAIEGGFEDNHDFAAEVSAQDVLNLISDWKRFRLAIEKLRSFHAPHSKTGILLRQAVYDLKCKE